MEPEAQDCAMKFPIKRTESITGPTLHY